MSIILSTTLVITAIGIVVAAGLVYTGKKFAVKVDEREIAVREKLPGNNCGACGYAGCDALAAAIAKGDAPVNACPVGGAAAAEAIGDIMGTESCICGMQGYLRCDEEPGQLHRRKGLPVCRAQRNQCDGL